MYVNSRIEEYYYFEISYLFFGYYLNFVFCYLLFILQQAILHIHQGQITRSFMRLSLLIHYKHFNITYNILTLHKTYLFIFIYFYPL